MSSTVWVTGANGFIGKHLLAQLTEAGYQPLTASPDITDIQALRETLSDLQPDYIIHLAAIAFVPDGDNADVYRVNTIGTDNLLTAACEFSPRKILLASTAQVYGSQTVDVLHEDLIPAPVNHYGCSKLAMEHIAATYRERLNVQVVRPFNTTGRGQPAHYLIPKLVKHFNERQPHIELGNLDIWRDISDVRRLATIFVQLLDIPQNETVNACSGRMESIDAVTQTLIQHTGHQIQIVQSPDLMRNAEVSRQQGDTQRLHRLLPGLPTAQPLADTLAWMLD